MVPQNSVVLYPGLIGSVLMPTGTVSTGGLTVCGSQFFYSLQ